MNIKTNGDLIQIMMDTMKISKGQAKNLIKSGAVTVNRKKVLWVKGGYFIQR